MRLHPDDEDIAWVGHACLVLAVIVVLLMAAMILSKEPDAPRAPGVEENVHAS